MFCKHEDAYIEEACCSPHQPIVECACQGTDRVVCPSENCDGILDHEVERLFLSLDNRGVGAVWT